MIRNPLLGPVLSAHALPLLNRRHFQVFHDKENEFTQDPAKMTEAEYRGVVLKGVRSQGEQLATLVEETKTLKTETEALKKSLGDSSKTVGEQAAEIVALKKSLVRANSAQEPNEAARAYFARAYPDECKAIGEALRAQRGHSIGGAVVKAETTGSLAAIVPPSLDTAIYRVALSYGAYRFCDVRPLSAGTESLIVEASKPRFGFKGENGMYPEVGLGLAPVGMSVKTFGGYLGISSEAVQDSDIDLGAYVAALFAEEAARFADYVTFMADGTNSTDSGGFYGICHAGTATSAAAGHTDLSKCTADELYNFMRSLGQGVLDNPNSCWMGNTVAISELALIKNQLGFPVFAQPGAGTVPYGSIGTIFGKPVKGVDVMPAFPGAGQPALIFGNPQAQAVGIRRDYNFAFNDSVFFLQGMRAYRADMRMGTKIKKASDLGVFTLAAA